MISRPLIVQMYSQIFSHGSKVMKGKKNRKKQGGMHDSEKVTLSDAFSSGKR